MKITVLGTAAIGYPFAFCNRESCVQARIHKGKSIRKRASAIGDIRNGYTGIDRGGLGAIGGLPYHEEAERKASLLGLYIAWDGGRGVVGQECDKKF